MSEHVNPYAGMTQDELEAAFTAEDPRYPARKEASEALDRYVSEWIRGYELDDGEVNHSPSELERFLIYDAFAGLTGDEEYKLLHRAWRELCDGPEATAKVLLAALQSLHDDIAEYARINNLGGFDNHSMKRARAALSLAGQQGQKT